MTAHLTNCAFDSCVAHGDEVAMLAIGARRSASLDEHCRMPPMAVFYPVLAIVARADAAEHESADPESSVLVGVTGLGEKPQIFGARTAMSG